jgi:hypothetical protein
VESDEVPVAEHDAEGSVAGVAELLRESAWTCTERGPGDLSVELDAESLPPARIRAAGGGLVVNVEIARLNAATGAARQSLAVFLLTATGALRLVRAYGVQREEQEVFGLQVGVPSAPVMEEASLLLNEAAARCYLAARDFSPNYPDTEEKEN